MAEQNIELPIVITVAKETINRSDNGHETGMNVMITQAGINLVLVSPDVGATTATIPWKFLIQAILNETPHMFGDLNDQFHQGFKQALDDLGFSSDGRPKR